MKEDYAWTERGGEVVGDVDVEFDLQVVGCGVGYGDGLVHG